MDEGLKQSVQHLAETYGGLTPPVEKKELYLEIEKFLSYLIAADNTLSDSETQFLNYYLDMGLKNRDLANFISSYETFSKRFAKTLPRVFERYLDNAEATKEYIKVMEELGKECLIADEKATEEEYKSLSVFTGMLNDAFVKAHPEERLNPEVFKGEREEVDSSEEDKSLEELLAEMEELIGLETVKQNVHSLVHLQDIQLERERRGLKKIPISNHLVFMGNPGTGKTTIARLIARIYYKLGVIKKNTFVEVDRSGLVAGYVGQTAIEVSNVMDSAKDGVLLVDEAYALSAGVPGDYGHEAIQTILKRMEDERNNMIVIVAGYPKLMEGFLQSNPGLDSRFSKKIFFPDYTPDELDDILKYMVRKNGMFISEEGLQFASDILKKRYDSRDENFANAREVRNMFEAAVVRQADRLYGTGDLSTEELQTLEAEDFSTPTLIIESE